MSAYSQRFSSSGCTAFLKQHNRKPYECNDQPVTLVSPSDYTNFLRGEATTFATKEELEDSGTLIVIISLSVVKNSEFYDPPLNTPIVLINHFQYRPNTALPIYSVKPTVSLFLTNQSEEKIEETFKQIISYKIQ